MNRTDEEMLLDLLKNPDEQVRARATEELWECWLHQKGLPGIEALNRHEGMIQAGKYAQAEALLNTLIERQPDFAEAWNRRAVMRFMQKRYHEAIEDCEHVVSLKPWHFGALHGLGLCHIALGEFAAAAAAFGRALEVQPFSADNQKLLHACKAKLN